MVHVLKLHLQPSWKLNSEERPKLAHKEINSSIQHLPYGIKILGDNPFALISPCPLHENSCWILYRSRKQKILSVGSWSVHDVCTGRAGGSWSYEIFGWNFIFLCAAGRCEKKVKRLYGWPDQSLWLVGEVSDPFPQHKVVGWWHSPE